MKATVLLFNFQDKDRVMKIRRALLPLGLRIRQVPREDYAQPVGFLAGDKSVAALDAVYEGDELSDEMLLMAGMGSREIDGLIMALRRQGLGRIHYKAMLTETNRFWDAVTLFDEIKKEHEAVSAGKSAHQM